MSLAFFFEACRGFEVNFRSARIFANASAGSVRSRLHWIQGLRRFCFRMQHFWRLRGFRLLFSHTHVCKPRWVAGLIAGAGHLRSGDRGFLRRSCRKMPRPACGDCDSVTRLDGSTALNLTVRSRYRGVSNNRFFPFEW